MNIGGKNFIPLPAFIPITFECTILSASLGMVGTFLLISDLKPYGKFRIFDSRSTDNKLVVVIDLLENSISKDSISSILTNTGALEINRKDFI
jgi:hypothetical protein